MVNAFEPMRELSAVGCKLGNGDGPRGNATVDGGGFSGTTFAIDANPRKTVTPLSRGETTENAQPEVTISDELLKASEGSEGEVAQGGVKAVRPRKTTK